MVFVKDEKHLQIFELCAQIRRTALKGVHFGENVKVHLMVTKIW